MAGTKAGAAKRFTRVAVPEAPSPVSGPHTYYVVGRRPVKHGDRMYMPGDTFPDATKLLRMDAWVRLGMLIPMQ